MDTAHDIEDNMSTTTRGMNTSGEADNEIMMMSATRGMKKVEWTGEATSFLIDLWEESIDGLSGARKNSHIYKEIAEKMKNHGVTAAEVKNKIENFTKKYRKEQTKVGPSGGTPSTWDHYEGIYKILSTSKAINYKRVMVESTDLSSITNTDVETSMDSGGETPRHSRQKRRRRTSRSSRDIEEEKLEVLKEIAVGMKTIHEKLLNILEKKNN